MEYNQRDTSEIKFQSKPYLLRKRYSTKLNERSNMIARVTKIREIGDKLSAIGENINSSHISTPVLCSLPPSYDTSITALGAKHETEITLPLSEAN